jgi:hypothetical protein
VMGPTFLARSTFDSGIIPPRLSTIR